MSNFVLELIRQTIQDQLVPLMSEAAFKGDVPNMQKLVAKGASVNQHDQVIIGCDETHQSQRL